MCRDIDFPSRQQGAGLPMAIFLITVMALIAVTIAQLQQTTGEMEGLDIQSTRAYNAAESGAQLGLTEVVPPDPGDPIDTAACTSDLYEEDFDAGGLAGCSVSVSCDSSGGGDGPIATLVSTGTCGSGTDRSERQIEVRTQ